MGIISDLTWRYATKRYLNKPISADDLNIIIDSIALAPTSLGLQAFEILVLDRNSSLRPKLIDACSKQPQITEASHLILFNAWKSVSQEDIDSYMGRISSTRNTPLENLEGFKSNIHRYTGSKNHAEIFAWSCMQTYIALGIAMVAAANLKIDSTPMEGFNREAVDAIINPNNDKLSCAVILALGYRNSELDKLSSLPKVRKSKDELVKFG